MKKILLLLFSLSLLSCGSSGDGDNGPTGYAPIYAGASKTYSISKYEFDTGTPTDIAASCLDNAKIETTAGSNELVLKIKIKSSGCSYNNATNPVTMFDFGLTDFSAGQSHTVEILMNVNPKYSGLQDLALSSMPTNITITETLAKSTDKLIIEASLMP